MLFLLTHSPQKPKLEKIHATLIILFYGSLNSPQLQRICFFFIKNTQKATTLQQVTGGNTPNFVLKRIQEHFLEKNSNTQENIRILNQDLKQ